VAAYATWNVERGNALISTFASLDGPLLPILHALQKEFGYIDREAERLIADALNISRADVHGVVTFYHDFREQPAGRHVLKLCRAEACQASGGDALAARAKERLGVALGNTTDDGRITLEATYCLGLCSVSPAAMMDGKLYARLDRKRLDLIIDGADR
jgi:formate dehydrogenase subunit gamma